MFGMGKNKRVVGIDIGSSSVKMVELKLVGKELAISKIGIESLPLGPRALSVQGGVTRSRRLLFAHNSKKYLRSCRQACAV